MKNLFINLYIRTPGGKAKSDKMLADIKEKFKGLFKLDKFKKIEFWDNSQEDNKILMHLEKMSKVDEDGVHCGKLTGSLYCDDKKIHYIASEAIKIFSYSNLLHPDLFSAARFIDSQLIKIGIDLFNGKDEACGMSTNGGTFSILSAIYAYRHRGEVLNGIKKPNIVMPISAHAAFIKACEMFKIKCIRIPLDPLTSKVNLSKMKSAINKNTICIVGSCPNFPHTIADDIEALSAMALRYNVPLHVDCCLGGFLVAFYQKANIQIPKFDFTLPGVTSISADLHKYGLCPKGISLLMFASNEYRKYAYFCYPKWIGGVYCTPSFDGSRTGGLIAASYAILTSLGKNYYVNVAKKIHEAILKVKKASKNFDLLEVIGDPFICGIAFTGPKCSFVYDLMSQKGWHLNFLQTPIGFSFIFTSANMDKVDNLIEDLKDSNDYVKTHPELKLGEISKIYGMVVPVPESVAKLSTEVLIDALLE